MGNSLSKEKSRYLRQHSENPVDWHAWSPDAFEKAAAEGKPLLVSIGYSSCHWCHVMAHESFEDPEVAAAINDQYVPIKVDKEELPDVDGYYMEFLTRLSGRGGWPLNVFVNPNRAPFYGASYVPRGQIIDLLAYLRSEYDKNADLKNQRIDGVFGVKPVPPEKIGELFSQIDLDSPSRPEGPQFPQGTYLSFALQRGEIEMVRGELEKLLLRGLFDHIEGGWFRYSVDPDWRIPHFEKMLYDQAAMLFLCAQAHSIAPEATSYAIEKSASWLEHHMRLDNGLYGSATDADTAEGEGFYYTIEPPADEETRALFRAEECGIHEGRLLPWLDFERYRVGGSSSRETIESYRRARGKLVRPALDSKAVVSWNAFLGYALLACEQVTENQTIGDIGRSLYRSLLRFVDGSVPHVVYGGEAHTSQEYLEDYAALLLFASALPEKERGFDSETLIATIKSRFSHDDYLFHTTEPVFESLSMWQDTPTPSGGAMLLSAMLNLGREELEGLDRMGIAEVAAKNPTFFALWCSGIERARHRPQAGRIE